MQRNVAKECIAIAQWVTNCPFALFRRLHHLDGVPVSNMCNVKVSLILNIRESVASLTGHFWCLQSPLMAASIVALPGSYFLGS